LLLMLEWSRVSFRSGTPKIMEEKHAMDVLFFQQEKSFQDLWRRALARPAC
jgi:hypothetical protein